MRKNNTLSPFPFYGGKYRMAPLIIDMLDYSTDLYIEPFGGACRVLLNKPRHAGEIYNDTGYGLCSFFEALSNPDTSGKVVEELYKIEPDEQVFYEMLQYKLEQEQELTEALHRQFQQFIRNCIKRYESKELRKLHGLIGKKEYESIIQIINEIDSKGVIQGGNDITAFHSFSRLYKQYWEIVKDEYGEAYKEAKEDFEIAWEERGSKDAEIKKEKLSHIYCHREALEEIEHFTNDVLVVNSANKDIVKMAVATFITYYFSRDGMGITYSTAKNKSLESYYNYLANLEDVAKRFEGVVVTQADALTLVCQYCENENVMMYLDPSYLEPEKSKKDLGKNVYSTSYSQEQHSELACAIQDAKAKIIISNYNVNPYKEMLTEEHGWKHISYETTTGVGSKKNNFREEILWYNY